MRRHELILLGLIVLTFAGLGLMSDRFLTVENLLNQARLMAEVAIVAVAMTLVILSGGIDLSVGATLGLCAVVLGVLWQDAGLALPLAIGLTLVLSLACGLVNGLFILGFGMPPLIATLGTLALYRGLAEGIAQARSVRGYPDWFSALGQGTLWGLPVQVWLMLLVALAAVVGIERMRAGRLLRAIGHNETAARFSGLDVRGAKLAVYAGSGLAAGLAALIFVSRVGTTRSDMGTGLELDAITAVVLGGTSIFGGKGSVLGTILALILIQALKSGLLMAGIKGDGTVVLIGLVLILTLLAGALTETRARA